MNAQVILERLKDVRRSGGGWMARCPAHEDRSPSLSIHEGDGKILLHCHAGCTIEKIGAALRIKVSELFSKPGKVRSKPRVVREADRQIAGLRSRLTPRERVLPVTIVYVERNNLDAGIARALALATEGEIVQAVLADSQ